jgi:hypothetical protein
VLSHLERGGNWRIVAELTAERGRRAGLPRTGKGACAIFTKSGSQRGEGHSRGRSNSANRRFDTRGGSVRMPNVGLLSGAVHHCPPTPEDDYLGERRLRARTRQRRSPPAAPLSAWPFVVPVSSGVGWATTMRGTPAGSRYNHLPFKLGPAQRRQERQRSQASQGAAASRRSQASQRGRLTPR